MSDRRIRKAVFPVAGLGTRLLPATKTIPKELITVVDRPVIQYAVDEAREAGIEQMILVTAPDKDTLNTYFNVAAGLEATLKAAGKDAGVLDQSNAGDGEIKIAFQDKPLGLGHAVWCARELIGDEPFAVLLPDDLMVPGALKEMVAAWSKVGGNLIATEEVAPERTSSYGIIDPGTIDGKLIEVRGLVEKPRPEDAPSRHAAIGRYILQPDVMRVLDAQERGAGGEIQLTDALAKLIGKQPFHALRVDSTRYDCGDKAGFVWANVAIAVARSDIGPTIRAQIDKL